MKKTFIFWLTIFVSMSLSAQTQITAGMTGAQLRTALNNNFNIVYDDVDTLELRVDSISQSNNTVTYSRLTPSDIFGIGYKTAEGSADGSGYNNTYFGTYTGNADSSGRDNVFIGWKAGEINYSAYQNTFVGSQAGRENKWHGAVPGKKGLGKGNGSYNSFFGYAAGYHNSGSGANTFIGWCAGHFAEAINEIGDAEENTYVGAGAGLSQTRGSRNAYFGFKVGQGKDDYTALPSDSASGAYDNVMMGYKSGQYTSSGDANIYFGFKAGMYGTTASNNLFAGYYAGLYNVTSSNNIFIGDYSGQDHSTDGSNVFIGRYSGNKHASGAENTYIGNNAGRFGTTNTGCVFIGNEAGYNETGNNKLFITNNQFGSEAADRTSALIYGDFSTAVLTINNILKLTPINEPPTPASEGMIYADTDHHLYYYNGSTWKQLDN